MKLPYAFQPLLACLLLVAACSSSKSIPEMQTAKNGELIFQSGFESNCKLVGFESANPKIIGSDLSFSDRNSWDILRGEVPIVYFNFTGGDTTKRFVKIIDEPTNPNNKVLYYKIIQPWVAESNSEKARVQLEYYGIKGGYKEFMQSVRVFLPQGMGELKAYPSKINWFTIAEFWNNITWRKDVPYGFRVTLGLGKPTSDKSELNFILDAQDCEFTADGKQQYTNIWNKESEVKVPIGKWFTLETYFKEGNQNNGKFSLSIQADGESKKTVFDVTNFTHNTKDPNPTGITEFNPMKMYTSKEVANFMKSKGKSLEIYWDDLKIWKDKQPGK